MAVKKLDTLFLEPGSPYRLGACHDGKGINFALFSEHAERVELCLFSEDGSREVARGTLPELTNQVWHGYLPNAGPGTVYGYRVYGAYQPELGLRFNPNKLLLDPYARQITGNFSWTDAHYGYRQGSKDEGQEMDTRDNARHMYKGVVTPELPVSIPQRNRIDKRHSIIYEAHIKGMTMLHPAIPEKERGRFMGMGHDSIIQYLKALGITSVELLPIHAFLDESFLTDKGLSNYWGYNTLNFFAPHPGYLNGSGITDCREMIERFHDAGMEVILDVVYNHTAEGSRLGPTLSFRGIDNLSYYRLQSEDKRYYINDTGCGNTLNIMHPMVVRLVMDSLRYWVTVMKVDGFRFDLGTILGREHYGYDRASGFFDALNQDPTLAAVKFIAEPWDIGPGGYQLGHFPPGWSEWNDRYRDTVRRFWRGDNGMLPEFARRVHGSSDIFEHGGRRPSASLNFVTSHDGFTLNDLVSYNSRHNEMNLENNQDGHSENFSYNHGVEGPSMLPEINEVRSRQQRNMLTTLLVSQGTPMLAAGDEVAKTQQGNNNAYCQDNEINWIDWSALPESAANLQEFVKYLIGLKKKYDWLNQDRYLHDTDVKTAARIEWYNANGEQMQSGHWGQHHLKTLGYLIQAPDEDARCTSYCLTIFHAGHDSLEFTLPQFRGISRWQLILDTSLEQGMPAGDTQVETFVNLAPCSTILLYAGAGTRHSSEEQLL